MKGNIRKRVEALRAYMKEHDLEAFYFPGTDPHMSEYLCDHWQIRKYITGFAGSYGEVVVTADHACLWTDSRYFLQALEELEGTGIAMLKLRVPESIPPAMWLALNLPRKAKVGADPYSLSLSACRILESQLKRIEATIVFHPDIPGKIWTDRPPLPENPLEELPEQVTGESRISKITRIMKEAGDKGADLAVVTALDDLAWSLNLRGSDIDYNPVFMGFGVFGNERQLLFTHAGTIPQPVMDNLNADKIEVLDYHEVYPYLENLTGCAICLDPGTANTAIWKAVKENNHIIETTSIPSLMKAAKNSAELEGFRTAMLYDGAAMVRFLHWLKKEVTTGVLTEYRVARKLGQIRENGPGYRGESFSPIAGYKDHGAIVHFSVTQSNSNVLKPEGILLTDSGGQYETGTTDITRTIALGEVTEQQKRDFTLVLKGMIGLSTAIFPAGTKGAHLDILARQALWQHELNYGHGTGHGVGHFLNVHEGPASIRQDLNPHAIVPGMVFSNEPGLYRTGEYGIRIENMIVCVEKTTNEFGTFYGFETLTLCPIDISLIIPEMLSASELEWINAYHHDVREKLKPLLSGELITFLEELTEPF